MCDLPSYQLVADPNGQTNKGDDPGHKCKLVIHIRLYDRGLLYNLRVTEKTKEQKLTSKIDTHGHCSRNNL